MLFVSSARYSISADNSDSSSSSNTWRHLVECFSHQLSLTTPRAQGRVTCRLQDNAVCRKLGAYGRLSMWTCGITVYSSYGTVSVRRLRRQDIKEQN